nr:hypothetical protein [Tanacetum cinerariifolium]
MDEVCALCCCEDGKLFDNYPNPTHFKDFYNSLQQPQTHSSESFNDNPNFGYTPQESFVYNQDPCEMFSQSPPQINQRCCYGCGDPLDGLFCQRCTCEFCGNSAHYSYDCPPQVPVISNPDLCYNQNFDYVPQTSPTFQQQYLCCTRCGGPRETFQCQPMNQNHFEHNSNYSGFDQPPQYSIDHQPQIINQERECEIKIYELKENFNGMSIEINKKKELRHLEQDANLSTYHSQHFKSFFYDDDDDYDYKEITIPLNKIYSQIPSPAAITPDLPITDSLIMKDEHLDTISETKSDKEYESCVKDLNLTPSESEDLSDDLSKDLSDIESECDVLVGDDFMTFSNPLFDSYEDSTSIDDESFCDEDVPKKNFKIYSNPLFDEEIISTKIDTHHFNTESDLIESLLNRDTSIVSSPKFDSLLEEFFGELALIDLISLEIDEADFDPEEEIYLVEKLFDSFMEEIDIFLAPDDSIPSGIENDDYDSERDVLFLKELLNDDSIFLFENESFYFNHYYDPSSPRPPAKPQDDDGIYFDAKPDTGILIVKVVDDISERCILKPRILPTQPTLYLCPVIDNLLSFSPENEDKVLNLGTPASKEEKPPHLLSYLGFKAFQLISNFSESPMMIYGGNIPILDVSFFYFYPP